MPRLRHRETMLDVGIELLLERGYAGTGVQVVLELSGAPKGSFYHHFPSKQAFAIAALDRWWTRQRALLADHLDATKGRAPRERLLAYLAALGDDAERSGWRHGCLLGTLGQEAPALEPELRARVNALLRAWKEALAELVPGPEAAFAVDAWEGALIAAKLERSRAPLDRALAALGR